MNKKAIHNIGIFTFIVIISGWIGVAIDLVLISQPEGDSLGIGIWLVLPLLTAFIIILFSKESRRDLGFKLNFKGNIKWYLASVLIFPEFFRVTKSVWPCVILHTVEDSLINLLVISGYISVTTGREIFISPINGVVTSILYVVVGIGIRAYRRRVQSSQAVG